jgi:hypothetical protein
MLRIEELDANAFFLTSYYRSIVSDWRKSVKKQLDVTQVTHASMPTITSNSVFRVYFAIVHMSPSQ